MSKFNAVIGNPRLEEHFIHFVGFRHMHRYSKHYIDPTSKYEPEIQGMYYETMRDGAFDDLKVALREEVDLDAKDRDFRKIVDAAIADVIGRLGMEFIVRRTKEFLWEIEERDPNDLPLSNHYAPKPELSRCPTCNRTRILLGVEDLPVEIFQTYTEIGLDMDISWLCLKCSRITNE